MKAVAVFVSLAYALISPSVSELLPKPDSPSTSQVLIGPPEGPIPKNSTLHRNRRAPEIGNQPLHVNVTSINSTSVKLEWTNGQEGLQNKTFQIRYGPLESVRENLVRHRVSNMTHDLSGLKPDTQYLGTICESRFWNIENCRQFRFFTDALDLQLEVRGTRKLLVSANWSIPETDSFTDNIDYMFTLQKTSRLRRSTYSELEKFNKTSFAIGIVSRPVPFFCKITVCLQYKKTNTLWSRATCKTTESPPGPPRSVTNLHANASETSLTLSWNDPEDVPPTGVLELFFISLVNSHSMKETNFTRNVAQAPQVGGIRHFTAYNLEADSVYDIRISTKNENVDLQNTVYIRTKTLPLILSAPRSFLAVPRNGTSVLLSWLSPEGQGSDSGDYFVTINGQRATCAENSNVHHRCEITGLTPSKTYRFGVSVCNGRHCSNEITQSVTLRSAGGMDTWVIVLLCFMFIGVFIFIPLMLWKGKKLVDRLTQPTGHERGCNSGPVEGSRSHLATPGFQTEDTESEYHVYEDPIDFSTKARSNSMKEPQEPHIYDYVLESNLTTEVGGDEAADRAYANVKENAGEAVEDFVYENVSPKRRGVAVYENESQRW